MQAPEFKTELTSYLTGLEKAFGLDANVDLTTTVTNCSIEYDMETELKRYGVKGTTIFIRKVTARIEWETTTDDLTNREIKILRERGGKEYLGETIAGVIELDSTKEFNNLNWNITDESEFKKDGSFTFENVDIFIHENRLELS